MFQKGVYKTFVLCYNTNNEYLFVFGKVGSVGGGDSTSLPSPTGECERVASLPAIRNKFRSQTEAPTHKADSRGRLSLQKINCARGAGRVMKFKFYCTRLVGKNL